MYLSEQGKPEEPCWSEELPARFFLEFFILLGFCAFILGELLTMIIVISKMTKDVT
jgi:hypothetical protein